MCEGAHRRFIATSSKGRPARQFAVAAITSVHPHADANVVNDCELVIGELVANAINAGADIIDVSVQLHHDRIELAVTDDAHGWPVLHTPDPAATSGRGLQIIGALATRWGVTIAEDRRTIVWADLPCDPTATTGVQCQFRSKRMTIQGS